MEFLTRTAANRLVLLKVYSLDLFSCTCSQREGITIGLKAFVSLRESIGHSRLRDLLEMLLALVQDEGDYGDTDSIDEKAETN